MALTHKYAETWNSSGVGGGKQFTAFETWGDTDVLFDIVQTTGPSISGAIGITGNIEYHIPFDLDAPPEVALNGLIGVSGDIEYVRPPDIVQSLPTHIIGSLGIGGDIQYVLEEQFAIQQTAPIGISGDLLLASGEFQFVLGGTPPSPAAATAFTGFPLRWVFDDTRGEKVPTLRESINKAFDKDVKLPDRVQLGTGSTPEEADAKLEKVEARLRSLDDKMKALDDKTKDLEDAILLFKSL